MKYLKETNLSNFEFWAGAKQITEKLTAEELDQIGDELEACDFFGELPTDTQINDAFWFDSDSVLSLIGLTEEEVLKRD